MEHEPMDNLTARRQQAEAIPRSRRSLGRAGLRMALDEAWMRRPPGIEISPAEYREAEAASRGLDRNEAALENEKSVETVKNLRARVIAKTASANMAEASFKLLADGRITFQTDTELSPPLADELQEVADLVCQGFRNAEIAEALEIDFQAAKDRVTDLYAQLGASNRSHVPRRMFETGRYVFSRPRSAASSHSVI